jgi:hypothetical protein
MDDASDIPTKRRIDGITGVMVVVTVASLLGAVWLRTRRPLEHEPAVVGSLAPPLRLLDLETSEPIVLVGLRGKVVWVVFWSADSSSVGSSLAAIGSAWGELKTEPRLATAAAAVEVGDRDRVRVRAAAAESGVKLPVYLATAETRRRFGALQADPPLNVLIDGDGHIATIARGTSPQTIERITAQARRMLDELGPVDETRFANADLSQNVTRRE